MSSYKGSYWRGSGLDRGVGSFSSASSTSSLASTSGVGSSSVSKYSTGLSLKSTESTGRSPSREPSYSTSLTGAGRATTPTSRYSSLSSRVKDISSSSYGASKTSSIGSSSYSKDKPSMSSYGGGVSALTSRFGSTLSSSTSTNTAAESSSSSSIGATSSFRPSATSGYLRSTRETFPSKGTSTSSTTTTSNSLNDDNSNNSSSVSSGPTSTDGISSTGITSNTNTTGSSATPVSPTTTGLPSTSGLSSYKPYTPRTLLSTDIKPMTAPTTSSSSLRTTARYGLKSGSSHAHYSVSTATTLKAAAILTEEAKKQLSKTQYQKEKEDKQQREVEEVTSWMNRGTCTILDFIGDFENEEDENNNDEGEDNCNLKANDISNDAEPSFTPRTFSPRYDGVLKHKLVQTEEEPKSKYAGLTAIPRPSITMNFNSPFTAVMSRFNAEKSAKAAASAESQSSGTGSSTNTTSLIARKGSLKKAISISSSDSSNTNGNNLTKDGKTGNNNKSINGQTTATSTSSDQLSRSSFPSRQTSPASRRNSLNNKSRTTDGEDVVTNSNKNVANNAEQATITTSSSTKDQKITPAATTKASSPPASGSASAGSSTTTLNAGGLVVNLANKEFVRKSMLNVGDATTKGERKQEAEMNSRSKAATSSTIQLKSSVVTTNSNEDNSEQSSNSSNNTRSNPLSTGIKRDSTRRPPTDPNNKSSTPTTSSPSVTNQQLNRSSIGRMSSQYNLNNSSANSSRASSPSSSAAVAAGTGNCNSSPAIGALARIKSSKNVNPLRKLSLENSNASDSDSSMTSSISAAARGIVGPGAGLPKLKKKLTGDVTDNSVSISNSNVIEKKGSLQFRKGSTGGGGTTCSSTASSRSGSVERGNNATNAIPVLSNSPSLHPSNLCKSISKSDNRTSLKTSPTTSSSDSDKKKKKGPVTIQITPETPLLDKEEKHDKSSLSEATAYLYNVVDSQQSPEEVPKQTPFFLRMMNETPWVRKCQSGDIPWWMASNPDLPGTLGRNSSKSVIKVPTAKDIQEELAKGTILLQPDDDSSSSELSDIECDDDGLDIDGKLMTRPLGERTSPDGREIPSITLPDDDSTAHKSSANNKGEKEQLFIGTHRNIDDILGFLPPNLLAPSPSPGPPTPTPNAATNAALQEAMDELVEAQRKLSLISRNHDGDEEGHLSDSESSSSSDLSEDEDDPLRPAGKEMKANAGNNDDESVSSSDEDEDDDRSTGTSSSFEEVDPASLSIAVPPRDQSQSNPLVLSNTTEEKAASTSGKMDNVGLIPTSQRKKLDDATLQIYRDGDYGTYLDPEASISEQQEEFEGFHNNRKNSIVLRAQLPVRVHAIIEKLINSDGRDLRRALFSLKQIFQEDKDLVHEFVENGGLSCLIKVGSDADQNYQNYILRAIGQVMLYVDGMYGVMRHNETIQWLYSLTASKFRLVQKTALKLLLVFVEYVETNCLLLVQAVSSVDGNRGAPLWSNVMNLIREHDSNSGDTELLIYAMTLVNKVLNGIPDLDTYYDQIDALEEQGMANIIQNYMGKQCADLDLIQQFQIYEMVLKHEDGEEDNIMMQLDETMRQKLLTRKGYCEVEGNNKNRRKSRRRSTTTPPSTPNGSSTSIFPHPVIRRLSSTEDHGKDSMDDGSSTTSTSSHSSSPGPPNGTPPPYIITAGYANEKCNNVDVGMTPGLRRRRERSEQQKCLLEQKMLNGSSGDLLSDKESSSSLIPLGRSHSGKRDGLGNISCSPTSGSLALEQQNNLKNSSGNGNFINGNCGSPNGSVTQARPWMLPIYTKTNGTAASGANIANGEIENGDSSEAKREHSVKDLTQKLANQSLLTSPVDENKSLIRSGELSGVVSKAKEGLAKSKSRVDLKPSGDGNGTKGVPVETKKSDNDFHWDFLVMNLHRSLEICDLDFTDLKTSDDEDIMAPNPAAINSCHIPPPLPPSFSTAPPPPPGKFGGAPPPPSVNGNSMYGASLRNRLSSSGIDQNDSTLKKTKKTVKLFWKEVREDPITATKVQKVGSFWSEIQPVPLDTSRLEHLFESRAKDVINKKQSDANKTKEITVLDPKRSNAINIGMTKLPPPRTIKAAIMKMDSTIINREGIEKLLSMLPTEEERAKITEAQFANPETPLGSAEQFLLTLASISELSARLKLWAFKLDYENLEKEVAEPLMDLKQGLEALEKNKTFRQILTTLLCIGNFLNGADAKGFQIDYLAKVPEVKDTVHKHSLLHHLCHMVLENYPESSDLYSEIGAVTRASRVDFDEVATNLTKMECDCKASWDHLKVIAKHDGPTNMKLKMSEFLADCAERIIVLGIIHRRVMNRFHKFLLWLGVPAHQVPATKPQMLFKIVSEFALEYRTTRERVIQQLQKKASHRERNKTRGKMITEQIMYKSKEDKADAELRQVLTKSCAENGDASLTWLRRPKSQVTNNATNGHTSHFNNKSATLGSGSPLVDGDDEILESLVKTATRASDSRVAPRERKRNSTRYSDRKSLRRTLRHGLSEEERKMLAAFMANGHSFC